MADNITVSSGSYSATVATDEVTDGTLGTVQVQFTKLMDGTLNSTNKLAINASGAASVSATGAAAAGAAVSGNPVRIGGSDSGTTRDISIDASGRQYVVGAAAAGAAASGNPVLVAGSDGTNARTILTDSGGRQVVNVNSLPALPAGTNAIGTVTAVGAAADGAAVSGNPVRIGASDGTNTQNVLSDTSGRLMVVGAGAAGSAVAGNPVLMAGSDGTNARTVAMSTLGEVQTISAVRNTSGSLAALNAALTVNPLDGYSMVGVAVSGTFVATLAMEGSIDGTNWFAVYANGYAGYSANVYGSITGATNVVVNVRGLLAFRVRCSAYTSGSATVALSGGNASPTTMTVVGGAADGSASSGYPVQVGGTDGTNAQTILTDTSGRQVVNVNSLPALPAGSNAIGTVTAVGNIAAGSAISGNPVQIAGSDGTNVRRLSTDTGGALNVNVSELSSSAALADGVANPTAGMVGAPMFEFNGSTWDRARGMSGNLTTGDSGGKIVSATGANQTNVGNKGVIVSFILSAVGGTNPTCVFKLQGSVNGGNNWYDIPGATTAPLSVVGTYSIQVYPGCVTEAGAASSLNCATSNSALPRTWRVMWTLGGTNPSFTIGSIAYNYLPN